MSTVFQELLPAPIVSGYIPEVEKFTVSLQTAVAQGSSSRQVTVPDGHYWRVMVAQASFVAGAIAANRTFEYIVMDAQTNTLLDIFSPATQPASTTVVYTLGPGLNEYTASTGATSSYQQMPIPDLIWPFGTVIRMLHVAFGGDSWGTSPTPSFMIEDYIPVVPGESVRTAAIPVATPVLL